MRQPALRYEQGLYPESYLGSILVRRGPRYRRLALPYGMGSALQRCLLSPGTVRRNLFRVQRDLFLQFLQTPGAAPSVSPGDALTLSLMANTWTVWRSQALQSAATFWRWVTIKGDKELTAALSQRRGLVVVFAHQRFAGNLTRQLLSVHGHPNVSAVAGNRPKDSAAPKVIQRTQNALDALALLQQGQVILIAGEGRGAADPILVPFHGHMLPIPRGFAALAQVSQAPVIAAFSSMELDGHMTLDLVTLPTPTTVGDVDALVCQYAELLAWRWPELLPTMSWPRLAYLAGLPAAAQER